MQERSHRNSTQNTKTNTYEKQKNRLIVFVLSTLFVFLSLVAWYTYSMQKKQMLRDLDRRVDIEINLLASYLQDSLQRHDYAEAKGFLKKWQKGLPDIRHLAVSLNDRLFYSFGDDSHTAHDFHTIAKNKIFEVAGTKVALYFVQDIHDIKDYLRQIAIILAIFTVMLTLGFGFILWMILSRWILRPMQKEIDYNTKRLRIINRSYKALSQSSFALTHAKDEKELLDEICSIIHEVCGYPLVWIGYTGKDDTVDIVAQAGKNERYLDGITISYGNDSQGNGPTGRSIKQNSDAIVNDTQLDPRFEPWKERAKEFGFHSAASFPIAIKDNIIGSLTLYAKYQNAFIQKEIALLHELAANLAFGIFALRDKQKIKHLSTTDSLTQLYNRHKINETLQKEFMLAKQKRQNFGIVIMDIDHFKNVNDTYGHQMGDKVLATFAQILKDNNRKDTDLIGRWGGEEFILILPNTSLEDSIKLAKRLQSIIRSYRFETVGSKTASFGVSAYMKEDTLESLIKRADDGLYRAKETGRDKVVCLQED